MMANSRVSEAVRAYAARAIAIEQCKRSTFAVANASVSLLEVPACGLNRARHRAIASDLTIFYGLLTRSFMLSFLIRWPRAVAIRAI